MTPAELLTRWFDVRPDETRRALLSFLGAYSIMSFLILARALRTTFFVTTFDVTSLPYMTIAVAVLTLPVVGLFARSMGRGNPHVVYSGFLVGLSALIGAVFVAITFSEAPGLAKVANVAFYLVTVLGASLLTSGFWMVTAEHYSLRQAKRLFGLIGAGGTLGAMLTGLSVSWLTGSFSTLQLVPGLVLLLAAVFALQWLMPRLAPHHHHQEDTQRAPIREGLDLILGRPHLRNIAMIVFVATMVSTILEYQFIEIISTEFGTDGERMTGFFAAFYGWTGVIALLVQVFLAGRLMRSAGIAVSLAVLPALLLAGSAAMFLVPMTMVTALFWTTTGVRGADNSLRKSLHRSVLEYLYVPVPPEVRRKTKTFIDSVVDSMAGGIGAAILFLWVTWAGFSSRWLSVLVMALSIAFIYGAVRTGAQYARTVRDRLAAGDTGDDFDASGFDTRDLLTVTLTRFDLQTELAKAGIDVGGGAAGSAIDKQPGVETTLIERLSSADANVVHRALDEHDAWDETHVPHLTRLLARSSHYKRAVDVLLSVGEPAERHLIEVLLDENADFVIRRRAPRMLAEIDSAEADQALVDALSAGRFEVRYRAAIALSRRRKAGLATAPGDWEATVWAAIEREVGRDRPIWELQKILDGAEAGDDDFVGQRVDVRGELSLEHTFRKLSLVLDPAPVKMAFHGIIMDDENLKGLSLEYLEQVLPPAVKARLWPFIGDISEHQRDKSIRPFSEVVDELSQTGATLFAGDVERAALRDALKTYDDDKDPDPKKDPGDK